MPEGTALVVGDRRLTWSALDARICAVARALTGLGIGRGDRVAILSRNSLEYVEIFFGVLTAGGCAVPLPTMASAGALRLMIDDSGAKVLLASGEMRSLVEPFVQDLPGLVPGGRIAIDFAVDGWTAYPAWIESGPSSFEPARVLPGDDFNIIYSSGTTGQPKGIVHTHALRGVMCMGLKAFGFAPGKVTLISTPLYSNVTMITWLPSMCTGTTVVLMEKFGADAFLRSCEKERVTHAVLVPVQYERILRHDGFGRFDLSSTSVKFSTSAPLRAPLKREIVQRWPGALVEIYGLTEGGASTVLLASAFPDKLDSVGRPAPGCDVRIIDDDGNEVRGGKIGEIVGRSGIMMKGYQNRPDATEEMLWRDAEGAVYLRTGDLGRLDEDGFLYVLDRKKDMIISGGLNVYASDLESVLAQHDAVREVAVIGIPSTEWGETPLALVVLASGAEATADALRAWANERLGKSQRITRVELRDELPKSAVGKVLKRQLREPYWGA